MITPTTAMWLNVIALVLSVFANATWWGDLIGGHTAAILTGVMTTCVSAMNLVLHSLSSKTEGPLTKLIKKD